jgi:hypothetical protein
MNTAFYRFLKTESAKQNEVSTGMVLLDQTFKIPLKSALLIEGSATVGTTAIALQLASHLSQQGKLIVYFDTYNSGTLHRLSELDKDRLVIFKAADIAPPQLLDSIELLFQAEPEAVLIFENIHLLEKLWIGWTFAEFIRRLRIINPEVTIIATQHKFKEAMSWPVVVKLDHLQNIYAETEDGDTELAGHLAKLSGPEGSNTIYIDHYTGMVSSAYEYATLQIREGLKTKTSTFEYDGLSVRGAWKLVHEAGKKKRDELQIDQMYISWSD